MSFHVGQKVVCIDGNPGLGDPPPHAVTGSIYTVAEIYNHADGLCLNFDELWFEEDDIHDAGFIAQYFRPVKTTNIEIFTAMLAPTKPKVGA